MLIRRYKGYHRYDSNNYRLTIMAIQDKRVSRSAIPHHPGPGTNVLRIVPYAQSNASQ